MKHLSSILVLLLCSACAGHVENDPPSSCPTEDSPNEPPSDVAPSCGEDTSCSVICYGLCDGECSTGNPDACEGACTGRCLGACCTS